MSLRKKYNIYKKKYKFLIYICRMKKLLILLIGITLFANSCAKENDLTPQSNPYTDLVQKQYVHSAFPLVERDFRSVDPVQCTFNYVTSFDTLTFGGRNQWTDRDNLNRVSNGDSFSVSVTCGKESAVYLMNVFTMHDTVKTINANQGIVRTRKMRKGETATISGVFEFSTGKNPLFKLNYH